jgi:trans-2,3-dihydro-3-hydroxyanthranilate isomerase
MKLKFHTLDVFTAEPFTGNGLAVVLDAEGLSDRQMQEIAREFNLSETIFVQRPEDRAHTAKVRIFMPGGELPFAGHPTIGCAVLLASLKHKAECSFEIRYPAGGKSGIGAGEGLAYRRCAEGGFHRSKAAAKNRQGAV